MAHSSRTWTGARTPSALKRVRQSHRRNAILQPRRTAAKTKVRAALAAAESGDAEATRTAVAEASAALDLAYVAAGRYDGFWERGLHPWDFAAGILLVREAGGMVSELNGKDIRLDSPSILASNNALHSDLQRILIGKGTPGAAPARRSA